MVIYKDLYQWKENSIKIAKAIGIFGESVISDIENSTLEISNRKRPKNVWYGHAYFDKKAVKIYSLNPCKYLPNCFQKIFNQSGMDHELIGHLGNYFSGSKHDELAACVTQKIMAEYRGKFNKKWELAAKLIPIVQKYHKDIKLKDYK